jgi:hypothetical protein
LLAQLASYGLRASMICGIQPPFIVYWDGIAPVRMYSGYCRNWQRIWGMST